MPARLAAIALMVLAGCASFTPTPTPSQPTGLPTPTVEPTPPAPPTAIPFARFTVHGTGGCYAINYGSCSLVLLMEQAPVRSLFEWIPSDADLVFQDSGIQSYPEIMVTGPPLNSPKTIAAGRWAIGLGHVRRSDLVGQPDSGGPACVREFNVTESMASVAVLMDASFDGSCSIDIRLDPPATGESSQPVRHWIPPGNGELDDCRNRTLLLRFDPNGTVWYEDVDSGERVDVGWPEFEGWTIERSGIDAALVSPDGANSIPEWSKRGEQCLLQSGGQLWIGDVQAAWYPWNSALGDFGDIARSIVGWSRDVVRAVPAPAAVSVSPSKILPPNRATLRAVDREIARVGLDRWSEIASTLYIGGPFDGPGRLADELGSTGTIDFGDEAWLINGDGWVGRHVWLFRTPRGHLVWAPDETLTVWDNCSDLVVPPIFPGPFEPGYETGIDEEGGLMTLYVYEEDGDDDTRIVVDFTDQACRNHPVLGPMIEHLLADD